MGEFLNSIEQPGAGKADFEVLKNPEQRKMLYERVKE